MINLTPLEEHEILEHATLFANTVAAALSDISGVTFSTLSQKHNNSIELALDDITVFTNFTGTVQGNYALNIHLDTANQILGCDLAEKDFDHFACGLFEEVVNVAVGISIEHLKVQFGFLTFNSPVIAVGQIRFPRYKNCSIALTSEVGEISVNFAINMANIDITDKLINTMKKLQNDMKMIESSSYRDSLTGVFNRAYYDYYQTKLFGQKRPLSFVIFDVDKFKSVNDTFGHAAGDIALKHIAAIVLHNVRDTDIPIRFGGDEFIIILEESSLVGAQRLVERIMDSLRKKCVPIENEVPIFVSISAGISEHVSGDTFEELFRKADVNLYKAKEAGRNQICC